MKQLSAIERKNALNRINGNTYDVVIIGGGITGAGIALDAAARGLSTVLVEMQDFAAGTSSRSTKLVHGGLRYLKNFEVKMVADVGREREIVYENGPHVTHPEPMLLPIYQKGQLGKRSTSVGLRLYDYLAGVKKEERREMLTKKETLQKEPLLNEKGLTGGGYYVEYRTDDARLTIEVLKKAVDLGATLLNYVKVESFSYNRKGNVSGVELMDQLTGEEYHVYGRQIVNATGPWIEQLVEQDEPIKGKSLFHTKGIHIVFDQAKFPLRQSIYFDVPDGRMIFAIPRSGKTYVGTTDTEYNGPLQNPHITIGDKQYLLDAIHDMFPHVSVKMEDIESSWAGVRPLIQEEGKDPSEVSRKDEIWTSRTGLLTIAGGKLTGYRKMAEDVTDEVCKRLQKQYDIECLPCETKFIRLSGGNFQHPSDYKRYIDDMAPIVAARTPFTEREAKGLLAMYGTNIDDVLSLVPRIQKGHALPPIIQLLVLYAMEYELALTPLDFFMRRTGTLFFDIGWVFKWKDDVTAYMKEALRWSEAETTSHTVQLNRRIYEATHAAVSSI